MRARETAGFPDQWVFSAHLLESSSTRLFRSIRPGPFGCRTSSYSGSLPEMGSRRQPDESGRIASPTAPRGPDGEHVRADNQGSCCLLHFAFMKRAGFYGHPRAPSDSLGNIPGTTPQLAESCLRAAHRLSITANLRSSASQPSTDKGASPAIAPGGCEQSGLRISWIRRQHLQPPCLVRQGMDETSIAWLGHDGLPLRGHPHELGNSRAIRSLFFVPHDPKGGRHLRHALVATWRRRGNPSSRIRGCPRPSRAGITVSQCIMPGGGYGWAKGDREPHRIAGAVLGRQAVHLRSGPEDDYVTSLNSATSRPTGRDRRGNNECWFTLNKLYPHLGCRVSIDGTRTQAVKLDESCANASGAGLEVSRTGGRAFFA